MTFNTLGLSKPLIKAVSEQGYTHPTPIQKAAIAPVIEGRDILAAAQTGTGKTAGFTLPLLERLTQKQPNMKKYQIPIFHPLKRKNFENTFKLVVNFCH